MDPSQGSSTTSEPKSVDVTLICLLQVEQNTGKKTLPWDVQASAIVFELNSFGCSVQNIQAVLHSYGFLCSAEDLIRYINRCGLVNYDKCPYLVNDPITQEVTFKWEQLQARAPYWESYLYSMDGRQLRVKLTKGQVQTRVVDLPGRIQP